VGEACVLCFKNVLCVGLTADLTLFYRKLLRSVGLFAQTLRAFWGLPLALRACLV